MCNRTKRNIADCVIDLAHKKPISKITVQNVMTATNMSRQSFYYHFKDIYEVFEWYAVNVFGKRIEYVPGEEISDWILRIFKVVSEDYPLYGNITNEISWDKLVKNLNGVMQENLIAILKDYKGNYTVMTSEDWNAGIEFFTSTLIFHLIRHISRREPFNEEEILKKYGFITSLIITTHSQAEAIQESKALPKSATSTCA